MKNLLTSFALIALLLSCNKDAELKIENESPTENVVTNGGNDSTPYMKQNPSRMRTLVQTGTRDYHCSKPVGNCLMTITIKPAFRSDLENVRDSIITGNQTSIENAFLAYDTTLLNFHSQEIIDNVINGDLSVEHSFNEVTGRTYFVYRKISDKVVYAAEFYDL